MRTVGVEHGFTRMVRIGTDKKNPWTSVESVSSVFSFGFLHVFIPEHRGLYFFSVSSVNSVVFQITKSELFT